MLLCLGRPHFGHAGAESECSNPQSEHVINPILTIYRKLL